MSGGLVRDELGFLRARSYGRTTGREIRELLGADSTEEAYHSTTQDGGRTSEPVDDSSEVSYQPGDTMTFGPRITKATEAAEIPDQIRKEAGALKRAGYAIAGKPERTESGWKLRLRGLILPGGTRTDALILLPFNYPYTSPIGFYVRAGANLGGLDLRHLHDRTYYGAPKLDGWQWFCGVVDEWRPGRHTLVTYINIVLRLFNERRQR